MFINKNSLSKQLFEGGEGIIYQIDKEHLIKIYKENPKTKQKKIELMAKISFPDYVFGPLEAAYDSLSKEFIGFKMKMAKINEEVSLLSNKKFILINNIKIKSITSLLISAIQKLQKIHENKLVIGDLNDKNILFDIATFEPLFIDVDSWAIEGFPCDAILETFKDPQTKNNNFNTQTDMFSFCVLAFKSLARIHPYGGISNPDMNLLQRMNKRISVIDNKNITVAKSIGGWSFMSPYLLEDFKNIFEGDKRYLPEKNLLDFHENLAYCEKHGDYYYSKMKVCPVCSGEVIIQIIPTVIKIEGAIPYSLFKEIKDAKYIIHTNTYISLDNKVKNFDGTQAIPFRPLYKTKYLFNDNKDKIFALRILKDTVEVFGEDIKFDKISDVVLDNSYFYFVTPSCNLVKVELIKSGNQYYSNITKLAETSFNCLFDISDESFFACNLYTGRFIFNIDGFYLDMGTKDKIINYGMHHDKVTNNWLFVYENQRGIFRTLILKKNKIVFDTNEVKYYTHLNNIVIDADAILIPADGYIEVFNTVKNTVKRFNCPVATSETKLVKKAKLESITENKIYYLG